MVAFLLAITLLAASPSAIAWDSDSSSTRESPDDGWWTGPILASSADTTPQGHLLVEPYFVDATSTGSFDGRGSRHNAPRTHSIRSSTSIIYGLTDRTSIGIFPTFGFNRDERGAQSAVRMGDLALQAQYRLTGGTDSGVPTISILLSESIPTGRYDRLGPRALGGMGYGAYVTTASVYSQYFFWLPTGRLLRTRLDLSYSISAPVNVRDVSVYGTPEGFRGRADPGNSFAASLSEEYSLTRSWVLALEVAYQHSDNTTVTGSTQATLHQRALYATGSGARSSVEIGPEIEYSWSSRIGLLAGTIFTPAGRNAPQTLTTVVAVNCYL